MATDQRMDQCKKCAKITMHVRKGTSHVLHLLLSLITFGVWLPVWIILALNSSTTGQCTECGHRKGLSDSVVTRACDMDPALALSCGVCSQ